MRLSCCCATVPTFSPSCRRIFIPSRIVTLYVQKPFPMNTMIFACRGVWRFWRYIYHVMFMTLCQGRLSPNNHGAITPILTSYFSPFIYHPPPLKHFLDIAYTILCNFMRVFSEFWKLSVRDNDQKIQIELIKHGFISKWGIKRNGANILMIKFVHKIHTFLC